MATPMQLLFLLAIFCGSPMVLETFLPPMNVDFVILLINISKWWSLRLRLFTLKVYQNVTHLPGYTRSVYERDYALITPESQVFSPVDGWFHTLCAYLVTPAMGSHFSMFIAKMIGNSSVARPHSSSVERFVFVIEGDIEISCEGRQHIVQADGFAYLPPDYMHEIRSNEPAMLLVYERRYSIEGNTKPAMVVGRTDDQPLLETPGEVFALRKLLPTGNIYDFNIHVMDFQPGEYLNVKEVHYNQHGLLLLEGRGIYRLGKDWHPVQAGDVIWMAPYVPQWYAALGRSRSRYILYKDVNRDPLFHSTS